MFLSLKKWLLFLSAVLLICISLIVFNLKVGTKFPGSEILESQSTNSTEKEINLKSKLSNVNINGISTLQGQGLVEASAEEEIHLVMIVSGGKYFNYSLTVIKSIVLFTQSHLQFYIFTQDDSGEKIQEEVFSWPSGIKDRIQITPVSYDCQNMSRPDLFLLS